MRVASAAVPAFKAPSTTCRTLNSSKHTCLVDYGNYHFLFELVSAWPSQFGRMSYLFGEAQLRRNTAAGGVSGVASGGVVRGLPAKAAAADRFLARYRTDIEAARAAVEQLNRLDPDVVIGANNPLDVQIQIAKWCRDRQRPFVFWLQDLRGFAVRSALRKRIPVLGDLVGRYYTARECGLFRQSAHIISIADEFLPHVLSTGVSKNTISVIPNWAPINRIPLRPKVNPWSRAAGLSEQRVVLYTGNLGIKHNSAHLLALCEALKDQPDTTVAVVAEGVGVRWLEKQATERGINNLFVHPFVKADVLPDVLGAADVCVVLLEPDASVSSVPSKIWSYFCGGKPLVMSIPKSNQGALIAEQIGVGVCSEPADQAQFVFNCLSMLSKSCDERCAIGARGRAFAEANFETDVIIRRVAQCIDLALQSDVHRRRGRRLRAAPRVGC
jgi:colanic acid biosynthesis glycosyl transferase WcaI